MHSGFVVRSIGGFRLSSLWALVALAWLGTGCESKQPVAKSAVAVAPVLRFGLAVDSLRLRIQDTVVRPGNTLGALLGAQGLSAALSQRLIEASEGVFNVRDLRAGQPLHLVFDPTGRLRHLIYEPDHIQWVRFDLDSVPRVQRHVRQVDTVARTVGGTIEVSLWNSLAAQGHSPALISQVAEILAWQIDFFTVQPGDQFRVMYKELRVDGEPIGLGDIQAVSFSQSGVESQAFLFRKDGVQGYYDAEGRPTKRLFLKAPLQFSRISSTFSAARMHPVLRIVRPHYGVDYAAPSGTPVMAVGDGTVLAKGWDPKGGGNYLKIRHNGSFVTEYMHLKGFAARVRQGGRLQQGEVIGYVGATGMATGAHLDFRFFRDGRPVNPLTVQPPPAPPLGAAVLPEFLAQASVLAMQLQAVATDFRARPTARRG